MLTGQESLKRLIGKRRRYLPNRHSIFSTPLGKKSVNLRSKEENVDFGPSRDSSELDGNRNSGSEWVSCPVCGVKISCADEVINSHLDACLARGTKRKLSQQTLFQLNFCSRSGVTTQSVKSNCNGVADTIESENDDNALCDTTNESSDSDGYEEDDNIKKHKYHLDSVALQRKRFAVYSEDQVTDNEINNEVDSASLAFEGKMSECDMKALMDEDDSNMSLETFIVGRRFADETELNLGAKIFLLRDPENAKDASAVKVLPADPGCGKMLGFIPRELAQYLSSLMDKFHLRFEGCITSVPKHSLAVIPIKIVCHDKLFQDEKDSEDFQVIKSLWKHAVNSVELAKTFYPNITKYQCNLVLLIQEVLRCHSHIFTDAEKTFLETLTSLSDDSLKLFARLYTRKGPWFRMSTICYPEILDCNGAIMELAAAGFIRSLEAVDEIQEDEIKEVLNTLKTGELRELASTVNKNSPQRTGKRLKKCHYGTKKQDLISLLVSSYKNAVCLNLKSLVLSKTSTCIRITIFAESLIWRAERLFFLNGEQDLSSFLLVDLGIVKYPTYNCLQTEQIFKTRNDFLHFEEAIEVAQIMDESLDENNSDLVTKCIEVSDFRISYFLEADQSSSSGSATELSSCFSASWVYSKVVLLGVSFLERKQSYADAINLLKRLLIKFTSERRRGYWTLRLSVDLEHLGRINESLQAAEDGLLDPWVRAGSKMALQRRVLRLGKPPRRWKIPSYSNSVKRMIPEVQIQGIPLNSKIGKRSIFYNENGEQCGVEEFALQYYAGEGGGWQGVHTESGIWLTFFGLLMWDIIFSDVPNAFCTKFQTAPLDLETDNFYSVRESLIEEQLKKIKDGMAEEILIKSWQSNVGTACRGVNWDRHSLSELRAAVTCIGGPSLASILRHLAQDYRSWSSGMPDLLLWRFHNDYTGEAKLVEVKGPKDRLSEQQRAWLLFLVDCGFSAEVCKVSSALSSK